MQSVESLGRKVLAADPTFLWVVVVNDKGETLAQVYSKHIAKTTLRKQTKERLGTLDTVLLEAFSRAEKWYGRIGFLLLAYKNANVMLMYSRRHGVYLVAKVARSGNAEYLYAKVKPLLRA